MLCTNAQTCYVPMLKHVVYQRFWNKCLLVLFVFFFVTNKPQCLMYTLMEMLAIVNPKDCVKTKVCIKGHKISCRLHVYKKQISKCSLTLL